MSETWTVKRVLVINLGMAGLQFCFACYWVVNAPYLKELQTPSWMLSLIMVLGPVCGFFTAPIVGAMSDRSTNPKGRRRNYLIVGCVLAAAAQLVLGVSAKISGLFFAVGTSSYYTFAQFLAIVCIVVNMIFSNCEMAAFRGLIADCVPPEAQNLGSAYFGLMMGGAYGSCSVIMLILYKTMKNMNWVSIYPIMSTIAAAMTVAMLFPTLLAAKEVPQPASDEKKKNVFKELAHEFKQMRKIFYRAMLPLFVGWASLTPIQQFTGIVFNMETTFIANICLNVATMIIALLLSPLVTKFGERTVFLACATVHLVGSVILLEGSYFPGSAVSSPVVSSVAMALVGFISCAMSTIPYIFIGKLAPTQSKGLYNGIFNCVIVIGQALANVMMTVINAITPKTENLNTMWVATVFAVGAVGSCFVITNTEGEDYEVVGKGAEDANENEKDDLLKYV